jgi:hypothetical protein
VLQEVELFVGGGRPEVLAQVAHVLALGLTFCADDLVGGLLAKRRIGQDHVEVLTRSRAQCVINGNEAVALGCADTV